MKRITTIATALVLTAASAAAIAQDRSAPTQARLTMAQALVIAEVMGDGRCTYARYDTSGAQPYYEMEVSHPTEGRLHLHIAAEGGRIIAADRLGA